MSNKCECNCGYTCGGPGKCELWKQPGMKGMRECIEKHFKKDCGHKFEGPLVDVGNNAQSIVCKNCGTSALAHDSWVGP